MRERLFSLCVGMLVFVAGNVNVWAQATAQISGTVKDQSGAVLPGVEVTATQTDTGIARSAVTNETGSYVLPNLAIGPYRLEAALPGFRTFVQTGIVLEVNGNPVINPVLQVGQVTETVEVTGEAPVVETTTATVTVTADQPPVAALTVSPSSGVASLVVGSSRPMAARLQTGRWRASAFAPDRWRPAAERGELGAGSAHMTSESWPSQ